MRGWTFYQVDGNDMHDDVPIDITKASVYAVSVENANEEYHKEKIALQQAHERQIVSLQITQLEELLALATKYEDIDLVEFYRELLSRRRKQYLL